MPKNPPPQPRRSSIKERASWPLFKARRVARTTAGWGRNFLTIRNLARRLNNCTLEERMAAGAAGCFVEGDHSLVPFASNEYDLYIKTEETIHRLLARDRHLLPDDCEIMPYPLGHWLNTIGLTRTNKLLRLLKSDQRRILICQHLFVRKLDFQPSDLIFTPHARMEEPFFTIPHYAVNFDEALMRKKRGRQYSFIGSTKTHWTRQKLVELYPENCLDSGAAWGLNEGLGEDFSRRYIASLGDSKFSLCPRGTGISSVRIFESMAMGSIPVIIADSYKKPLSGCLDWDAFSVTVEESNIENIEEILNSYSQSQVRELRETCLQVYEEWFSHENLHKTVLAELKYRNSTLH